MSLLTVLENEGFTPRKNGTAEFVCSCPGCGDGGKGSRSDRFHIWPDKDRWWCRQCGKSGDKIQFFRDFLGLSYNEASLRAGKEPKEYAEIMTVQRKQKQPMEDWRPAKSKLPDITWRVTAEKIMKWAHHQLLKSPDQLTYLEGRGLSIQAIKKYQLGYVSEDLYRDRSLLGLEDIYKKNGIKKKLWIPQGILIPSLTNGVLQRVRIRRGASEPRYYFLPGSSPAPMVLPSTNINVFVVVESELDAFLLHHSVADLVGIIALGNSSMKPDQELFEKLREAACLLISLDSDAAGAKASRWWVEHFPQAKRWPVVGGKDPGEAWTAGLNLIEWISCGLPIGLQMLKKAYL